ncbi:UDP-N-acetylmuramate dehydrogenase [Saccharospirillum salsuginis]|uniref:UDP-N-acetylenolpyruvoylglucosamine reductase n=1 Tax=Saccharospirillum salsuginis TaxID=418750 RepID=A0A918K6L0_9GAMM|nr:UDP-N-acetylmuramate dehydrogenase [Saccharospirillum salsuginis]GGX51799.1 UDP-N-acetylenolpyruvoylglucosamine reductase [Saccharospirillum salsuginis]
MTIQRDVDLSARNTLGVTAHADYWADITDRTQIPELVDWAQARSLPVRVLGGGSNLVMAPRIRGLVLGMNLRGRQRLDSSDGRLEHWRFQAGENWHECVRFSVEQGLSGLENLALIPGQAGAAPIQNIGAYGVELSDVLVAVDAFDTVEGRWVRFASKDCDFAYRDSRFKQASNRYIITSIDLELSRDFHPVLDYGPLQSLKNRDDLTPWTVMDTVISVRQSKLPDPGDIPNAGSFFKNPLVSEEVYRSLKQRWPELVAYPSGAAWKLAAGWLIDQCGLKGQANASGVGCYDKQALVVVNPRRADGSEILDWQRHVQSEVESTFGVRLEREPRLWNGS